MDKLSGECIFSSLEKMIYGPGKVVEVGKELERLGGSRTILVTGRSLARSPLVDRVKQAMGGRCAGVFQGIIQHGAEDSAEALAAEMRRLEVDSVVSFGGSSVSDTAKVAVAVILSGRRVEDMATMELFDVAELGDVTRRIPHICLPTTLSAGEYTPGGGATDRQGLKGAVMNPVLQIDVIINDPELSVETSDELWTSTGIRALDHIVEAFYSQHSQSFTDALAGKAAELLFEHLPASVRTEGEERIMHRGHCLTAAWLSNYAAMNTRYGVSHAVGHKIGPMWNVPHGITSCVSLPFAMRFMAARYPERFVKLAAALKVRFDTANPGAGAGRCIERVEALIDSLGLPRSISALGIPKDEIHSVTPHIRYEIDLLDTVGRPVSDEEVNVLLDEMYPARNSPGETEQLITPRGLSDMAWKEPPTREWIDDTKRFDARAHEKLVALLDNYFETGDRLSAKLMHLIWIGVDLVVTHLYSEGAKVHMQGALEYGATPEEIVEVLEIASTVADRSLDVAFPIIFEEVEAAGIPFPGIGRLLTVDEERLKTALTDKLGFLPRWFDLAVRAAPEFVQTYLNMGHAPFKQGALDPKSRALVYLGLFSSPALIDAHEIRNHVREALARGATAVELLDVVQLVGGIGLHAFTTGIPLLAAAAR